MKPARVLVGVIPVLCLAMSPGDSESPPVLRAVHFSDDMNPERPVAGETLRGVVWSPTEQAIDTGVLMVHLPAARSPGSKLCITASTRDGAYQAKATYDLGATTSGEHKLDFPTSYADRLRSYRTKDLALLAELSDDCEHAGYSPPNVVPVGWGRASPGLSPVLFVNSQGSDVLLSWTNGGKSVQCSSSLTGRPAIAFDCECAVPGTVKRGQWLELSLQRWHFEDALPEVPIRLWQP